MTSTEIAQYRNQAGEILGLGKVDAGDMVSPRFAIDHNKGVWVNSQTKAEYTGFTAILLARVKQRIMWKDKLEDNADPRCRSNNFEIGFPNENPKSKTADLFPWPQSVFRQEDFPHQPEHGNLRVLPCANCDFKNWHGDDKPACKEQWTFAALIFLATPGAPDGEWTPALITIQGTGLSSVRGYISTFIQRGSPLFTQMTAVSLTSDVKAGNTYYIPVFTPSSGTEPEQWNSYGRQTGSFVDFLEQDPRAYEVDSAAIAASAAQQAPAITEPEPPAVAAAPPVVETPAPVATPETPIAPPPVAPAPAVSTPAPVAAPAAPAQPAPAPAAAPEPAVAPAPAPATAPTPAAPPPTPAPAPAAEPVAPAPPAAAPAAPVPAAPAASTPPTVGPGKLPF